MDALRTRMNAMDAAKNANERYGRAKNANERYGHKKNANETAHDGVHSRTCAFMRVHFNPQLNVTITSGWCSATVLSDSIPTKLEKY